MAHAEQLLFVKIVSDHIAPNGFQDKAILEIGSYDVNGSVRPFFLNSRYVGIDLVSGPGVDCVGEGHNLNHPDETYDLTLSCESFEHNPEWSKTLSNMLRMTKAGGTVLFTCATAGRLEHGTTRTSPKSSPGTQHMGWDYYLNLTESDFRKKMDFDTFFDQYIFLTNHHSKDLYFIGQKKGPQIFSLNTALLNSTYAEANHDLQKAKPLGHKVSASFDHAIAQLAFLPERQYNDVLRQYCRAKPIVKRSIGRALKPLHARKAPCPRDPS